VDVDGGRGRQQRRQVALDDTVGDAVDDGIEVVGWGLGQAGTGAFVYVRRLAVAPWESLERDLDARRAVPLVDQRGGAVLPGAILLPELDGKLGDLGRPRRAGQPGQRAREEQAQDDHHRQGRATTVHRASSYCVDWCCYLVVTLRFPAMYHAARE
jgi:hypothetical protein